MPMFEYTARNPQTGQIQKGQLDVATQGRRHRVSAEEPDDRWSSVREAPKQISFSLGVPSGSRPATS